MARLTALYDLAESRGPRCIALCGAFILLVACTETRYVSMGESAARESIPFLRTVAYDVDPAYRAGRTDCILILPTVRDGPPDELNDLVEAALARHLAGRVDRVIDPQEREQAIDYLDLEPDESASAGVALAAQLGCDSVLASALVAESANAFAVWSELRIGLDLRLIRADNQRLLWRARHVATRSRGGVPMSLPSLVVNSISAAGLSADRDAIESLVDDAARRLVAALPE